MIKLIFPVFLLHLHFINAQSEISGFYCSSGRPITPIVGVPFSDVYDGQPYRIVVSELSDAVMKTDNICFSYIKSPRSDTVVAYDIRKTITGSLQASPSITIDGGPGIVISSSKSCTYIDYTIASVDECQVNIIYRFAVYGYCKQDMANNFNRDNEVYALTPLNNTINYYCRNRILQTIADYGFGDRSYYFYPQKLPSNCVSAQLCSIPTRNLPGYPELHY